MGQIIREYHWSGKENHFQKKNSMQILQRKWGRWRANESVPKMQRKRVDI
jgi:hypothetical protein